MKYLKKNLIYLLKKKSKIMYNQFMGILDWISQSAKKLKDVESQINEETKDVLEVYQKNIALEREIAQRTVCARRCPLPQSDSPPYGQVP